MLKVVFWNTGKTALAVHVAALQSSTDADIILLAECDLPTSTLLMELNRNPPYKSYFRELRLADQMNVRVRGLTRLDSSFVSVSLEASHYFTWQVSLPNSKPVLLFAVHLRSRLHANERDQTFYAKPLLEDIREEERRHSHENTVIIGDFNMSPFDDGVSAIDGFHAVMDRRIAREDMRQSVGRSVPYFYNPMWSLLGDGSRGPPGSYFYRSGHRLEHFWYMFDQVLLRPSLLRSFENEDVNILTELDGISLLDGRGRIGNISDHLPLSIGIKPEEIENEQPLEDS